MLFLLVDLLPTFGAPFFRYTGSDPSLAVWNFGWPLAELIYDRRSGFHIAPFMSLVLCLEVIGLFSVGYLSRTARKEVVEAKLLGASKLPDVPTEVFNAMITTLRDEGWKKVQEYKGFDAWINHGMLVLQKGEKVLRFEWDNSTEGRVEGQKVEVDEMCHRFALQRLGERRAGNID